MPWFGIWLLAFMADFMSLSDRLTHSYFHVWVSLLSGWLSLSMTLAPVLSADDDRQSMMLTREASHPLAQTIQKPARFLHFWSFTDRYYLWQGVDKEELAKSGLPREPAIIDDVPSLTRPAGTRDFRSHL